jgi:hypothetical protein
MPVPQKEKRGKGPGMVAHAYNSTIIPQTVIGRSQFEASMGKKLARPCLKNKPGVVVHTYNPSYLGGGGRIVV